MTRPVKALTVRQPWATLLCDPTLPKWIETRSRRTNVRGRIGIIAGKSSAGFHADPECYESGWVATMVGSYQACYCYRTSDEGGRGDALMVKADGGDPAPDYDGDLPLGYLIGTVDLYDCVPIVPCRSEGGRPTPGQLIVYPDMLRIVRRQPSNPPFASGGYDIEVCDDQRPYGDFTPGLWAWLTRDAVLLDEPIPMRGSLGWQTVDLPLPEEAS